MRFDPAEPLARSFIIDLGEIGAWRLCATGRWQHWLESFARILQLRTGTGTSYPRMIFGSPGELIPEAETGQTPDPSWPWGICSLRRFRFFSSPGSEDILCEIKENPEADKPFDPDMIDSIIMQWAVYPFYLTAMLKGGLPMHGALFERDGRVVLMAASGNSGKTTCCSRIQPPWKPLADDAVLVTKNADGSYRAHPFPTWNDHIRKRKDSLWDVQKSYPLDAIFFMEQSPVDGTGPLGQAQTTLALIDTAFQGIISFRAMTEQDIQRLFWLTILDNASEMARNLPSHILRVSLTGEFWKEMEKVL